MIRHANQHIHKAPRNRQFDDRNSKGANFVSLQHSIPENSVTINLSTRLFTFYMTNTNIKRNTVDKEGNDKVTREFDKTNSVQLIFTDDQRNQKKRKVLLTLLPNTVNSGYRSWFDLPEPQTLEANAPIIWNGPSNIIIKCNIIYDVKDHKGSYRRSELEHVGHVKVQKTGELVLV